MDIDTTCYLFIIRSFNKLITKLPEAVCFIYRGYRGGSPTAVQA